jgi:simple sugar transport system ATP-binding protein
MLSGGNMQKVAAARECGAQPSVLIAEQPTRGVDVGAAYIIHQHILSLRDAGCAILLISADLSEITRLSDHLLVMYEGRIVAYFEDTAQVSEEELGLCMLGIHQHSQEKIRRASDG